MKRLLAQIGITYFSVLVAAFYLSDLLVAVIGGVALLLVILFFAIKKARKTIFLPAMAIAALIACVVNLGYTMLVVRPVTEKYGDSEHTIRATAAEEAYRSYSKYYYRLNIKEIDGEKVSQKLLLKSTDPLKADLDDQLTFTAELSVTSNDYYRAKGYYLSVNSYDLDIEVETAQTHSLYYHVIRLREIMRNALDSLLPEDCAALCKAVLIGDKYALSTDIRDSFRYAGASYFIVVSGMHFAVICLLMERLLKRANRWVRLAIMLVFILIYAALTGFQPSVLRSGIMMTMLMIGKTVRRQAYPLNHLGIAGIVMPFIVSPYGAGDIGLILSFYATMAILLWASPIAQKICLKDEYGAIPTFRFGSFVRRKLEWIKEKFSDRKKKNDTQTEPFSIKLWLKKLYNAVALMFSVSLAANIMVFPISVFVFHEFSLVTLLSALLLYWEIYLILILSFAVCVLFWFKPLAVVLAYPLMLLCKLALWIVNGLASLPFAYIKITNSFIYIWLAVTVLLGIVVILCRNHYRYLKAAALCSFILLLSGCLLQEILQMSVLSLEVYPCSSGICAGINSGGRLHLLSMDGGAKELRQVWGSLENRYSGAETALCRNESNLRKCQLYRDDEFAISMIMLYDNNGYCTEDDNIVEFDSDCTFVPDDDMILTLSVNDDKAVPFVKAADQTILIVPKDCKLSNIPEEYRRADIIVLSKAFTGMEKLHCNSLIISNEIDTAEQIAEQMKGSFEQVYYTADGEVRCELR